MIPLDSPTKFHCFILNNFCCNWDLSMKTICSPKVFRKIRAFMSSFSNFKWLYFKKLSMDCDNLKPQNLISIYIL